MKNRKMILVVSLLLALTVSLTGTMAYLSDTDEDINVMTLGNVQIEQHEMKRKEGIAYDATLKEGDLVPFTDGIKLYPAYPKIEKPEDAYEAMRDQEDALKWGPYVHDNAAWNGLWSDENLVGAVDKMIFVENTGNSDAYIRTILAVEAPEGVLIGYGSEHADIVLNMNGNYRFGNSNNTPSTSPMCEIDIDGVHYLVFEFCYSEIMQPGEWTRPSLLQVVMTNWADNDTMALLGETYEILALSQAVQVENLKQLGAQGALDTAFGVVNEENATMWFSGMEARPVATASTADELAAAMAKGGTVVLTDDIAIGPDDTIVIGKGNKVNLELAGHTISATNNQSATHNFLMDVKGGELTISDGTIEMTHTGSNLGWNGASTIIDVTAGGVLNLSNVTLDHKGGTDMNFCVHLNNWGEVTLNVENSVLKATYCPVRVFNSGYDMNNVTITGTTLESAGNRCFWVHNYLGDLNSAQHSDEAIKGRLNFDIFGNDNTYIDDGTRPVIRYGFGETIYFTADGTQVDKDGNPI